MRIGLIDVDGHGSKKKWGATIYPNLALTKIARYHRQQGDEVEWAKPFQAAVQCEMFDKKQIHRPNVYDRIYVSKVFNFTPDIDRSKYVADEWVRGGTGYDIASQLPDEIDRLQPDYSIYPNVPSDTAYGFLTRGCPNKCPWCVVPRKEGKIRPYMDCDEIAIDGRTNLVLMDNNILAADDYAVEQLEKIIERGYRVDFNQALDARLVDDRFARLLAKVKWLQNRIRFGCDTHGQIKDCERAIAMINGYGYRGEYFLYTMIGGKSDFKESYERVHYWWVRNHEIRTSHSPGGIYPYAQPYRNFDNPNEEIPRWQKDMAGWVNKHQIFEITDFHNFKPRKNFRCEAYLHHYGIEVPQTGMEKVTSVEQLTLF